MNRLLTTLIVLGLGCGEGAVPAVADPQPVALTARERLEAAPVTFHVTLDSAGVFATRRVHLGPEHAPVRFFFGSGQIDAQAAGGGLEISRLNASLPAIELKLGPTPLTLARTEVTLATPTTLSLEWFGDGAFALAKGSVSLELRTWLRLSTGGESPLDVATLELPVELVVSSQGEVLSLKLEGTREGVLWSWAGLFEFADFKVIVQASESTEVPGNVLIN